MERELERLCHYHLEHKRSIINMEEDIYNRTKVVQESLVYGKEVKSFKKFQMRMLEYLQGHEIQQKLQYRWQKNQAIEKIIQQVEEQLYGLYKQISWYENKIEEIERKG